MIFLQPILTYPNDVQFDEVIKALEPDTLKPDHWQKIYQIIESNPALLLEDKKGKTLLWEVGRNLTPNDDLEDRLKFALKIIELAPNQNVNLVPYGNGWLMPTPTILNTVLNCKFFCDISDNSPADLL